MGTAEDGADGWAALAVRGRLIVVASDQKRKGDRELGEIDDCDYEWIELIAGWVSEMICWLWLWIVREGEERISRVFVIAVVFDREVNWFGNRVGRREGTAKCGCARTHWEQESAWGSEDQRRRRGQKRRLGWVSLSTDAGELARGGEEGPRPVLMVVMVWFIRIGGDDWWFEFWMVAAGNQSITQQWPARMRVVKLGICKSQLTTKKMIKEK
jgi:hypothetical protein